MFCFSREVVFYSLMSNAVGASFLVGFVVGHLVDRYWRSRR